MYYIINGDVMRRFKPKRRVKKMALFKALLLILITLFIFKTITNLFSHHKDLVITSMFLDNKYSYDNTNKDTNIFSRVYEYAKENIVNIPSNMLVTRMVYKEELPNGSKSDKSNTVVVNSDTKKEIKEEENGKEPLVYIYNSHQKEEYSKDYMEDYNVNPDVFLASHIMQEKLNNKGINTLVMEDDITAYLNNNNLDYSKSYQASRFYLKPALDKYKSVKLFIDLHRDSTPKDVSTIEIDSKIYAKVMFVIGLEYDTYETNLSIATAINDKINAFNPNLSRGILKKQGYGVNGVYNQDLQGNVILIELGGDKNNLEEITNTIDVLVNVIGDYVNEK